MNKIIIINKINEEVKSFIEGEEIHLSELPKYTDLEKIKKVTFTYYTINCYII